jgi:hypothetical protein
LTRPSAGTDVRPSKSPGAGAGREETIVSEPLRDAYDDRPSGPSVTSSVSEMRTACGYRLERIRNAVEVLACRMLEQKLQRCPEIDKSREAVEDMYCLALNRVPSLYYHSTSSFARRLEDQGPPTDILAALDEALDYAIMKVAETPCRDDPRRD